MELGFSLFVNLCELLPEDIHNPFGFSYSCDRTLVGFLGTEGCETMPFSEVLSTDLDLAAFAIVAPASGFSESSPRFTDQCLVSRRSLSSGFVERGG
jgi:hypothetical protein